MIQRPDRRILYIWDAEYPWDVRAEKICQSLTDAGAQVHLACRNRRWEPELERLPEATVHRLPPWRFVGATLDSVLSFPAFFSPRWLTHLQRVVRQEAIELVIVRDLPLCPTAIHVAKRCGIPVVLDMAENYPALLRDVWATGRRKLFDVLIRNPRIAAGVERWCLPRVDRVFTVVEESRDRVIGLGVPRERIDVVSNTPPLARVATAHPIPPRLGLPLGAVYLGIMELARGLLEVLEATAILRESATPVHLHLIGGGRDLPLIRTRAQALGLKEPWVRFYGFVPSHADALSLVASQQVGVLPIRVSDWANTTIPNKLFDYMAAGLPVVSSDNAPCQRILRVTGAGVCYRGGDPAGLAAALAGIANGAAWRRYSAAGIQAIREHYHWERHAKILTATVAGLVRRSTPPGSQTRQDSGAGAR